jgi:hypothetical protein
MSNYVLHCSGGLGNRLLGLASARVLCPEGEIAVYWPRGPFPISKASPRLDPLFEDLYEPLPGYRFVEKEEFLDLRKAGVKYAYSHGVLPGAARPELYDRISEFRLGSESLRQYHRIRNAIGSSSYASCLIRCHGHHKTRAWNPTKMFRRLLDKLPRPVFVCCDDPKFSRSLRDVVVASKSGSMGSVEQLITVTAEFRILAESRTFHAPPFTAMAVFVQALRGQSLRVDRPIGDWSII